MEEDKNTNRRRKSILVIDKKGKSKEVSKDISKSDISTLIDSTDKIKKSQAKNSLNNTNKDNSNINSTNNTKLIGNNDLSNSNLINNGLNKSNIQEKDKSNIQEKNKSNIQEKNKSNIQEKNKSNIQEEKDKKILNMKRSPDKFRNVEIAAGLTAEEIFNKDNINKNNNQSHSNLNDKDNSNSNSNDKDNINDKDNSNINNQSNNNLKSNINTHISINEKDKHVTINENINQEHKVLVDGKSIPLTDTNKNNLKARSPNSSFDDFKFIPQRIPCHNLNEDSKILEEREKDNVEAEGHFFKRRRIFACFWHEKYFLLTKTGILKYYKANGTRMCKGNWDLKNIQRIHEIFMGGDSHPFRLALISSDENILFGFDDSDSREYWLIKLSKFINK